MVGSKLPGAATERPGQGRAHVAVGSALGPAVDTRTLGPRNGGLRPAPLLHLGRCCDFSDPWDAAEGPGLSCLWELSCHSVGEPK